MTQPIVTGIVGWSGQGKTELVVRLVGEIQARGFRVSTIKHAHHNFDIDKPGKDSYRHRIAGATEVLVSSDKRWALIHENRFDPEPSLDALISRMSPVDVILIEGFKHDNLNKIEVFRPSTGKEPLFPTDPRIVAVATDQDIGETDRILLDINDSRAIVDFVFDFCRGQSGNGYRHSARECLSPELKAGRIGGE